MTDACLKIIPINQFILLKIYCSYSGKIFHNCQYQSWININIGYSKFRIFFISYLLKCGFSFKLSNNFYFPKLLLHSQNFDFIDLFPQFITGSLFPDSLIKLLIYILPNLMFDWQKFVQKIYLNSPKTEVTHYWIRKINMSFPLYKSLSVYVEYWPIDSKF